MRILRLMPTNVGPEYKKAEDAYRDAKTLDEKVERMEDMIALLPKHKGTDHLFADLKRRLARLREQAEAYRRAKIIEAKGEASRFEALLVEYQAAPEVTRRRLYLETMENVLGSVDKIILDESVSGADGGGQGVVPYLPLNELRRGSDQ